MRVRELKLTSFRNYRNLRLLPAEGINILYGQNAQGKSNILEAISLLATSRSLRASRESELILRGEEMCHVSAEIERKVEGDVDLQVSVFLSDKKAVRVNGSKRGRVIELLGQFNAVYFGSSELAIVTGDPSDRRHYLNVEISQISPRYVFELGYYKRVLEQRNRLLRELRDRPRPPDEVGLDAWNEQLVRHGAHLVERRKFYIERLAPLAAQVHRELTDGLETLEVIYLPSVALPPPVLPGHVAESREDKYLDFAAGTADAPAVPEPVTTESAVERIAQTFRDQLERIASDELRRGTSLIGPQRDDMSFSINGLDARIYGSQGQQRTVALAIKLAECRLIEEYLNEPPVILLDDVMSDLDDARRALLLDWVQAQGQAFLTCTNLRAFPDSILSRAATFAVEAGTVRMDGTEQPESEKESAA